MTTGANLDQMPTAELMPEEALSGALSRMTAKAGELVGGFPWSQAFFAVGGLALTAYIVNWWRNRRKNKSLSLAK